MIGWAVRSGLSGSFEKAVYLLLLVVVCSATNATSLPFQANKMVLSVDALDEQTPPCKNVRASGCGDSTCEVSRA